MGNSAKIHAKALKVFIKFDFDFVIHQILIWVFMFVSWIKKKILIIWKIICDSIVAHMTNISNLDICTIFNCELL